MNKILPDPFQSAQWATREATDREATRVIHARITRGAMLDASGVDNPRMSELYYIICDSIREYTDAKSRI